MKTKLLIKRDTLRTLASGIPASHAPYTTGNCTFDACSVRAACVGAIR